MFRISNDIKKVFKRKTVNNGLWMYALQFFNTIIPIVILPYITRILGKYQYGVFSTSFNIVGYLQVLVEYGFAMSATRKVAIGNKDRTQLSRYFTSILLSRLLLLCVSLIFSIIYLYFWNPGLIQAESFWLLFISLIGIAFQENWLFQGLQDMKYISIANITARLVTTILIFKMVKTRHDVLLYCFLYALSPVISNLIGLVIVKVKYKLHFIRISIQEVKDELKDGWYIFTTQITGKVFGSIGITFLIFFSNTSEVGIYSAIQKIPNIIILLWMPISQIMYPITSKKMNSSFEYGKKFVLKLRRIFVGIFAVLAIVLSIFAKPIVWFAFGHEYASSYLLLIPLLAWVVISIDNNFWGVQILLGSGHDKEYSICFQINVLITIFLNLLFIYLWGSVCASLAPLVSEVILDVMLIVIVKNISIQKRL